MSGTRIRCILTAPRRPQAGATDPGGVTKDDQYLQVRF